MRLTPELRSAMQAIGNAAIGVGLGVSVLLVAFIMSQFAAGQGSMAGSAPTATVVTGAAVVTLAVTPTPAPPTAAPSVTPSAGPTDAPAATPTPAPTPGYTTTSYASGGRRYAALSAPVGYAYVAPFAGTVQVKTYQLIDGDVRVGSSFPALPFFPYVTIESADRRVIYRPGALNTDTQVLVKDGQRVDIGTPLFKTVGEGPSSWRTFYDRGVTANVIASVAALPSGAELDPVAFFTAR